ncbi:MAG: HTH domain-containing protein [Sulfuritalea sp.]|nr:HTH domain-containing protein [Sulfuritalea sp.]
MTGIFLKLAEKILKDSDYPLAGSDIWSLVEKAGLDKQLPTKGKTPWNSLAAQMYVEVRDNPNSIFGATETRPKRFFLKSNDKAAKSASSILPAALPKKEEPKFLEKHLHPFLAYHGFYYQKAYLKTIRHSKSDKKEFGEWVHPDMVGCYFPFGDWTNEVVEISTLLGASAFKLFSYELKRQLSLSNLREAFFQTVSNSSWANETYLAAADIDTDADFTNELERLSSAFGVGIIKLNIQDPDSSELILPARSRESIDWETANKLATMNPDFRDFLKRIRTDIASREVRREMYDKVLDADELLQGLTSST